MSRASHIVAMLGWADHTGSLILLYYVAYVQH